MNSKVFLLTIILTTISLLNIYAQDDFEIKSKSTVGGYGELHYNYEKPDGGDSKKTLDFHRFVIFYSHNWNEKWSFKSEVELEHNFVADGHGELELEQAYVNYHHADWFGFQVGVVLPSVGLLNEYHEPPLFLSVERPDYSKNIIPTTWFGNGAAVYGEYKGFSYKATIMEGLNSDKFKPGSGIRSGRQKGFKSNAEEFLYNFRVDYLNVEGLKIGASLTLNNAKGETTENSISLFEGHAQYNKNNLLVTAEVGSISYDNGDVDNSLGYYVDLGYNIGGLLKSDLAIIPFVRYTNYNTVNSSPLGSTFEDKYKVKKVMFGCALKPIESVVFKIDYALQTSGINDDEKTLFNFGAGYMF